MTTSPSRARGAVRLLALGALLTSCLLGTAATASADDPGDVQARSQGQCLSGQFCLWSSPGFGGLFWGRTPVGTMNTTVPSAGSYWNRAGNAVRVYSGAGATGTWTCVMPGALTSSTALSSASITTMGPSGC